MPTRVQLTLYVEIEVDADPNDDLDTYNEQVEEQASILCDVLNAHSLTMDIPEWKAE